MNNFTQKWNIRLVINYYTKFSPISKRTGGGGGVKFMQAQKKSFKHSFSPKFYPCKKLGQECSLTASSTVQDSTFEAYTVVIQ